MAWRSVIAALFAAVFGIVATAKPAEALLISYELDDVSFSTFDVSLGMDVSVPGGMTGVFVFNTDVNALISGAVTVSGVPMPLDGFNADYMLSSGSGTSALFERTTMPTASGAPRLSFVFDPSLGAASSVGDSVDLTLVSSGGLFQSFVSVCQEDGCGLVRIEGNFDGTATVTQITDSDGRPLPGVPLPPAGLALFAALCGFAVVRRSGCRGA